MNCLNNRFLGRERELSILESCYLSNGFEFITISGRDSSGKTSLIREFCRDKKAILFSSVKSESSKNLEALSNAISKSLYSRVRNLVNFKTVESALEFIHKMSEKGRLIMVIDNYDDFVNSVEGTQSLFRTYLSHIFPRHNLMLILSGDRDFMGDQSFGREPTRIELEHLSFSEVREAFPMYRDEDLVKLYGATGGDPSILRYFDPDRSVELNIDGLLLSPNSPIYRTAFNRIMNNIRTPEVYCSILSSIMSGPTPMKQIVTNTQIGSAAACSTYLSNLSNMGLVEKETPYREKMSRKGMYRIIDSAVRFWITYVQRNQSLIDFRGEEDLFGTVTENTMEHYLQQTFRDICVQFIEENCSLFGIRSPTIGRWWGKGDSGLEYIDIVIDSDDRMTQIFCDCRYRDSLVGTSVLNELIRKSGGINGLGKRCYALFSKSGFTSELKERAMSEDIYLFDLSDICWH